MSAILFALTSYVGWGTGSLLEAIVSRKLYSYSLLFWSHLISFILLSIYAPFALSDLNNLSFDILIIIFILAFVGIFLGTIFYYEALRAGNRALVGTITASFPAVTVVLSLIFLGDRTSFQQTIAIIIIFLGLTLSILDSSSIKGKNLLTKSSFFALLAMLTWGAYFAFIKIPVAKIGWFWPNYFTFFLFPLILIYIKFKRVKLEAPNKNNAFIPLFVSTILVRAAELTYNLGISKGLVTVVAPIAGANQTLFVVLAFLVFKDRITKQQIAGIITTLIGIVLLSVFSV